MDFGQRMFRIRRTCLEMLGERGYLITDVSLQLPPGLAEGAAGARALLVDWPGRARASRAASWVVRRPAAAAYLPPPCMPPAAGGARRHEGAVYGQVWARYQEGGPHHHGLQNGKPLLLACWQRGAARSPLPPPPPLALPTDPLLAPLPSLCRTTPRSRFSSSSPTSPRWG